MPLFRQSSRRCRWQQSPQPSSPTIRVSERPKTATPIFGRNYQPDDGLPVYVCGMVANGSYFVPQLIQSAGLDIANGFHLGLLPINLNEKHAISEPQMAAMVREGSIDCMISTLDSVALNNTGTVTLIVDESAGTDSLWARGIDTLNGLKGKRVAVEGNTSSEFLVLSLLGTVQLNPRNDVAIVRFDFLGDAIDAFNAGEVDAVSGYEPAVLDALKGGGTQLASTNDFRAIIEW